jgi:hypothetical protein
MASTREVNVSQPPMGEQARRHGTRMRVEGYNDGLLGRARRHRDGQYLTSYRRGVEARERMLGAEKAGG